jgi:hypothetical protein
MGQTIRHAKSVSPWFVPNKAGVADDFHGISNINYGVSVTSDDVFVVGKEQKCGTDKQIPEANVNFPQFERGQIQTYLTLANLAAEPVAGLDLADFSTSSTDVVLYQKDDYQGTLEQTIWFPKMVVNSIELNIADPEARIERTIDLTGDAKIDLNYGNKYLIHVEATAGTGDVGSMVIDLSDPVPVVNPNVSGEYILRVDRTRSGETITLDESAYSYNTGTNDLTIPSTLLGDVYNVYYSAASFGTAGDPTTVDTGNPCFLKAENVTVTLNDGSNTVELDLLTSLSLTATLNRISEAVIGNDEKILKEVESNEVTISLSGRVKDSTIAEVFMNKATLNWGINDVSLYNDNVTLTVKIYDDATKTNFLIGYEVTNLSFTDDSSDFTANEFGTMDVSATADNLLITTDVNNLTA